MKNPFLNTDHYSFVRQFKKRQSRVSSLTNSQSRERQLSSETCQNNSLRLSSSYFYPNKMDLAYEKYQNTFKKNQYEGAKLYGLDSLRYKPQVYQIKQQIKEREETCKLLTQKTFEEYDAVTRRSKQIKPNLKASKMGMKSSKNIKGKENLKQNMKMSKKRKTSKDTQSSRRKSSMLTSMLNLNFQCDDDYEDQSEYYEQETTNRDQIKRVTNKELLEAQIIKKPNIKKKNVSGFYAPFKESYGISLNSNQIREAIDFIISDRQKDKTDRSDNEIKKSEKKLNKSRGKSAIKIKKLPSINMALRRQVENPPQFLMLRGKKFIKFQRRVKSIRF